MVFRVPRSSIVHIHIKTIPKTKSSTYRGALPNLIMDFDDIVVLFFIKKVKGVN
jgi:hypothetical protein